MFDGDENRVQNIRLFMLLYVKLSKNVYLLITFVVAITNSTLLSSWQARKRKAAISAKVQPPTKNTKTTRGMFREEPSLGVDPKGFNESSTIRARLGEAIKPIGPSKASSNTIALLPSIFSSKCTNSLHDDSCKS
uniref:Uncharacterized protein n=1 Tax=Glossina palpalis gambiensis TaxID=67801 RepID=A0A1B0AST3_9MUSC